MQFLFSKLCYRHTCYEKISFLCSLLEHRTDLIIANHMNTNHLRIIVKKGTLFTSSIHQNFIACFIFHTLYNSRNWDWIETENKNPPIFSIPEQTLHVVIEKHSYSFFKHKPTKEGTKNKNSYMILPLQHKPAKLMGCGIPLIPCLRQWRLHYLTGIIGGQVLPLLR